AVARLYERYAELLPDGPERARAAATARSVAVLPTPDRWAFAPDAEATDHRTVGFGSLRGADAIGRAIGALLELTADFSTRIGDVLASRSAGLVLVERTFGTTRDGAAFERLLCLLWMFGADGLVTRWEQFDAECDAEALARFDELTGEPAATPSPAVPRAATIRMRPVRANAATTNAAAIDAAVAARDGDALDALLAD